MVPANNTYLLVCATFIAQPTRNIGSAASRKSSKAILSGRNSTQGSSIRLSSPMFGGESVSANSASSLQTSKPGLLNETQDFQAYSKWHKR